MKTSRRAGDREDLGKKMSRKTRRQEKIGQEKIGTEHRGWEGKITEGMRLAGKQKDRTGRGGKENKLSVLKGQGGGILFVPSSLLYCPKSVCAPPYTTDLSVCLSVFLFSPPPYPYEGRDEGGEGGIFFCFVD